MTLTRAIMPAAALAALITALPPSAKSAEQISVVATFSILGDMVMRIGGEHVSVTTLVGRNGDTHVYKPTPADARAVSGADVLFVNGLAFEGWIDRLIDASDFQGQHVVTTEGMKLIALEEEHHDDDVHHGDNDHHEGEEHHEDEHDEHSHEGHHHHGEFDPHTWHNLENGVIYAQNITKALASADPDNAKAYQANADAYIAEMQALDAEIAKLIEAIPETSRTVVTSHDAFGYFGKHYGLSFEAPQGISTESEPSAADVAKMITQIRDDGISAVFVESITDNRLLEQISNETDASIGGTLYTGALSSSDGPAATYLEMLRHNAETLAGALNP